MNELKSCALCLRSKLPPLGRCLFTEQQNSTLTRYSLSSWASHIHTRAVQYHVTFPTAVIESFTINKLTFLTSFSISMVSLKSQQADLQSTFFPNKQKKNYRTVILCGGGAVQWNVGYRLGAELWLFAPCVSAAPLRLISLLTKDTSGISQGTAFSQ